MKKYSHFNGEENLHTFQMSDYSKGKQTLLHFFLSLRYGRCEQKFRNQSHEKIVDVI